MAKKNVHESEELNSLLGKRVKIVLTDNTIHTGVLGKESNYSERYRLDRREMYKADFVEVVRCGKCKHNENGVCIHPENITHSEDCDGNVYDHYLLIGSYNYCSYGERRDT